MKDHSFTVVILIFLLLIASIGNSQTVSTAATVEPYPWDVNRDEVVDLADLMLVASHFGETSATVADVNSDGLVDITDLVLVATHFGDRTPRVKVVLDSPPDGVDIQDTEYIKFDFPRNVEVTFQWHIENPKNGVTYNYTVLSTTSANPFAKYVQGYSTNEETQFTGKFSRGLLWEGRIMWGVRAEGSDGQIYESEIRRISTFQCGDVKVILDHPPDDCLLPEGDITFRWHLENAKHGVTYNYAILFDKGVNPFDGWIETLAVVGRDTEYTRRMTAGWWSIGFQWGIMVESSDGQVCKSEYRNVDRILEQ